MDEKDAQLVRELIPGSVLIEEFDSMHNIHAEQPKAYLKKAIEFLDSIEKENR